MVACGCTGGLKPHDSRLRFPSGLSWAPPPLFWLALDLEGFFLCSKEWEQWSNTLKLFAPVKVPSCAVTLATEATWP